MGNITLNEFLFYLLATVVSLYLVSLAITIPLKLYQTWRESSSKQFLMETLLAQKSMEGFAKRMEGASMDPTTAMFVQDSILKRTKPSPILLIMLGLIVVGLFANLIFLLS